MKKHVRRFRVFHLTVLSLLASCFIGNTSFAAGASSSTQIATVPHKLDLYSLAEDKQFVNNADDRSRGEGNNPFGNYANPFKAPPDQERGYGPFAGDEGEFEYNLYTAPNLKVSAGKAILICQYNFEINAYCDASYQLQGGSVIAAGAFNFNAQNFTLAITGGTYAYRGVTGHVEASRLPWPQGISVVIPLFCACRLLETQRLAFVIKPT